MGNYYTQTFVQLFRRKKKSSLVFDPYNELTLANVKALDGDYTCVVSDGERLVESDVIRVDTMCKYSII